MTDQNTPAAAVSAPEPTQDMTGAEAVAYVNAQKAAPTKIEAPAQPNPIKEAAKEAARKYKVKVNGQEHEVEESELLRGYSHQAAANKVLQEGKQARKQAEDFIALMKDPQRFYDAAKEMGHNPRELAEKYLAATLEDEMMDPRDKELRDAKARLKHLDDLDNEKIKQAEAHRHSELTAKYQKEYETSFIEALKETKIPATKPMVAEMAKYISRSAKIGFEMTPLEAATLVREDIQAAQLALFKDSDGETLLRLLGDDQANKILQARGAKVKTPTDNLRTPEKQGEPSVRQKSSTKRMSQQEWRDYNRKR
jgi:hypothetical protein